MAVPVLKVEKRSEKGSATCRRLRREGRVPGVIYGHKEDTIPIVFPGADLVAALRTGARTLNLTIDGGSQQVVLKEVQYDPLGENIIHVDFGRISEHEVITVAVPIHLKGISKGVKDGGVLDQQIQEIEVRCPADAIPDRITVLMDDLEMEQILRIKDLEIPQGVQPTQDPEQAVLAIRKPEEEVEEPAAAEPEAEIKEPEVITAREKKEEKEEAG